MEEKEEIEEDDEGKEDKDEFWGKIADLEGPTYVPVARGNTVTIPSLFGPRDTKNSDALPALMEMCINDHTVTHDNTRTLVEGFVLGINVLIPVIMFIQNSPSGCYAHPDARIGWQV